MGHNCKISRLDCLGKSTGITLPQADTTADTHGITLPPTTSADTNPPQADTTDDTLAISFADITADSLTTAFSDTTADTLTTPADTSFSGIALPPTASTADIAHRRGSEEASTPTPTPTPGFRSRQGCRPTGQGKGPARPSSEKKNF
jgi:hypothetical protein